MLERLARGGSDLDAAKRLATSLVSDLVSHESWEAHLLLQMRARAQRWLMLSNTSLPFLLGECARGFHGDCGGGFVLMALDLDCCASM